MLDDNSDYTMIFASKAISINEIIEDTENEIKEQKLKMLERELEKVKRCNEYGELGVFGKLFYMFTH
jgi:hypothetical protein